MWVCMGVWIRACMGVSVGKHGCVDMCMHGCVWVGGRRGHISGCSL